MAEQVIYNGTGRRKTSIARVWLKKGDGKFVVNKKEVKEYYENSDYAKMINHNLPKGATHDIDFFCAWWNQKPQFYGRDIPLKDVKNVEERIAGFQRNFFKKLSDLL